MLKKTFISGMLITLLASTALATPSLGWWNEYDPGTTHQYWEFTNATDGKPYPFDNIWSAIPENYYNPVSTPEADITVSHYTGVYDRAGGFFTDPHEITVKLTIENYQNLNAYKEIWIDVGYTDTLTGFNAIGVGPAGDYTEIYLPGRGPSGLADFGFRIYPNPYKEDIYFSIITVGSADFARLDYIHVDTICVPEPATICLLGLGALSLLRRKRSV